MTLPNYPLPSRSELLSQFRGQPLTALPTPAVVLDRALVAKHCAAMLRVCSALGVGFRAHVKSHKTLEVAQMQVGREDGDGPADFIVSTVIEAEALAEWLAECQARGREGSILYGVPVPQSAIPRLLALAGKLAPGSVNVLVDNAEAFAQFHERVAAEAAPQPGAQIGVFIKIDTGYHRAGIATSSPKFAPLVQTVVGKSQQGVTRLRGFYSHFGHSYAGNSEDDAVNGLMEELIGLEKACEAVPATHTDRLVLTVGATPTATAAQNLLRGSSTRKHEFEELLGRLKSKHTVELHAGVYPLLDCQQVATHARPSKGSLAGGFQPLAKDSIAIRTLVEVTSVYDERDKPEALVSAGSLAMGREPCKSYPGWGIVTDALGNKDCQSVYEENGARTGWIVGRISQEHGILTWEGDRSKMKALTIGDKLSIWPNHACVAGAGFGWYLVVDSESGGEEVVDVWVRWRGW